MVQALLRERYGMSQAKRWDRVASIDVELAKYGVAVEDTEERVERAVKAPARR